MNYPNYPENFTIGDDDSMYYSYCPDCGDESLIVYPTGIGTREILRTAQSSLIPNIINYCMCSCGGTNKGIVAVEELTVDDKVKLRAVITLNK